MPPSNANHRRVIIVATTVLGLVAVDRLVVSLDPELASYDTRLNLHAFYRKPAALRERPMPDVVLMGSSRAALALVPDVFEAGTGMTTYNAAVASSQTGEWQALARRLFSERRPQLVVIGVNAGEFWSNYAPRNGAAFLFDFGELSEACLREGRCPMLIGPYIARRIGDFWATFHRRHELKMYGFERFARFLPEHAERSRSQRRRLNRPTPRDGYEHPAAAGRHAGNLQYAMGAGVLGARDREQAGRFDADATAFARFDELIVFLRDAGIEVIVAYLPNSPVTEHRWLGVEPPIIENLHRLCRAREVRFVNCYDAPLARSNREYMDEVHVGPELGRRISAYIVDQTGRSGFASGGDPRIAGTLTGGLEAP